MKVGDIIKVGDMDAVVTDVCESVMKPGTMKLHPFTDGDKLK